MQQKILILKNPLKRVIEGEHVKSLVIWKMRVKKRTEAVEAEVGDEKEVKRTAKKREAEVVVVEEMQKMEVTNHVVAEVNTGKMARKGINRVEVVADTVKMERRVTNLNVAGVNTGAKEKKVTNQDVVVAKLVEREKKEIQKVAQEANLEVEMT